MNKMRKLTSLFLVLAMGLALTIPCFAASPEPTMSSVPTISLEGKKPGDKVEVGDFIIEIMDPETIMPRAGTLVDGVYTSTSTVSGSFTWNCGTYRVLTLRVDCSNSATGTKATFDIKDIVTITDFITSSSSPQVYTITYKEDVYQSARVDFSFKPQNLGVNMTVNFYANESVY